MNCKISNEQLQMAALKYAREILSKKTDKLKFGVWETKSVINNLRFKSKKTKEDISKYQFCFVARYLGNDLKEADKAQLALIRTIKKGITDLFKDSNCTGKLRIFKLNNKPSLGEKQVFFVIPYNVTKSWATIHMKIAF